jgi:hypothetical protein
MLIPGIRLTVGSGGSVNADGVLFVQLGTPQAADQVATMALAASSVSQSGAAISVHFGASSARTMPSESAAPLLTSHDSPLTHSTLSTAAPADLPQPFAPIVSQQPMPDDTDSLLNRLPVRLLLSLREPAPVVDAIFGSAHVVTSLPAASVAALIKSTEIGGHVSVLGSAITAETMATVSQGRAGDELSELLDLLVWNQASTPKRRTR